MAAIGRDRVDQMRTIEFDQRIRKHFFLQSNTECLTDEHVDSGSVVGAGCNSRPASSGAHGKPPKAAVPPGRQPFATRFRYPSLPARHLLPRYGRALALTPKV